MENNEKKNYKKTVFMVSMVIIVLAFALFAITQCYKTKSKEQYLIEQYQKKLNLFNDWSLLSEWSGDASTLDKYNLSYYNIEGFEALYKFELQFIFHQELDMIRYQGQKYSKTEEEIDRKLDIFFDVKGGLYLEYGFEFSPGGGYFYFPKSRAITEVEYKNLQEKLALLKDFEKYWDTKK